MDKEVIKVGICDDKEEDIELIADSLRKSLKKIRQSVKVNCYSFLEGEKLYEATSKETFQLIFLDIEMPGLNGFELAERLRANCLQTYLIFVSVHESFVFDAQEYIPLWFVRKSMLERDMFQAMRQYFQVTSSLRVSYRLKEGFNFREVPIRDILYIECSGHRLTIQRTDGSRLEKYGSLKAMEEELFEYHFLRIHKNYLVNQKYIKEVGRREVYLTDQSILEMGRDRRAAVRKAMLEYEKEKRK